MKIIDSDQDSPALHGQLDEGAARVLRSLLTTAAAEAAGGEAAHQALGGCPGARERVLFGAIGRADLGRGE